MAILEAMYSDARFDMQHMTFFASALTSESRWNSTSHGTAPFSRVRFVTNFVDPQSTTDKLAVRGRAALKAYLDTLIPSDLPVEYTAQPMLPTLSYPALEGYLAVRWAAEALSRMPSINQSLFLDAIYARHLFFIDGVTLGHPFHRCHQPHHRNC
ncbi:Hypothetical protein, putative [Bodo saltans]|uniref:Uncharacterized protein n=1 Tax=Bodo saltans TaxID=75058 RepID=A0A0S4J2W7_BODSA|nr:Hypothetical protein, putative [Bodo saltans]|eukprot:CUG71306.1 Hypothetical protein, putative [Bodo saltans]